MITADFIIDKVRLLINETTGEEALAQLSEDTRSIDVTIAGLVGDAVLFVQQNKSCGALNPKSCAADKIAVTARGDGGGEIVLPDDFVSLLSLQMKGWMRPCTQLVPAGMPLAAAQGNVLTRGGCSKPVCVEGFSADGAPVLRFYSLPEGEMPLVEHFVYEAAYDAKVGINCPPSNPLLTAVAYECAALLYNVFENSAAANAFMALALSWCGKLRKE